MVNIGKEFTMNDSYLNTFGELFFKIDENDEVKNIIDQGKMMRNLKMRLTCCLRSWSRRTQTILR